MRVLGGAAVVAIVAAAAACASSTDATGDHACTPGAYVYCRCEDRSEGTKLCHADGKSFDACKCDGLGGGGDGTTGGEQVGGPLETVDAGGPTEGPHIDPACVGKLGIVAGSDTNNDVYVVGYAGDGKFDVSKSSAPVRGPITVLPAGGALVATYRSNYAILSTKYANGSWVPVSSIGTDVTIASPVATAMTAYGGDLKLVYLSSDDGKYHVANYKSSGWDDGQALAESDTASNPPALPDKSAPAIASPSGALVVVVSTSDGALARETYSNYSWSSWVKAPESAYSAPPALAAIDTASGKDLLLVWAGSDVKLHASSRDAQSKTWSNATLVDNAAMATEMTLAPMPNGGAMLLFKGSDEKAYYSVWSATSGFAAPKELVAGENPEVATLPSVTRGRCGSDLTIAYAQKSDGAVKLLRFSGGTMAGPFAVGGVSGASWVGVGEMP